VRADEPKPHWLSWLVLWVMTLLVFVPRFAWWHRWDPLDTYPDFLCLGAGALASVAVWRVWALPRFRERKSCLLVLLPLWLPMLAIGVGLGSNVVLDRSPAVRHDTTFLGYDSPLKGSRRARLASWRKSGAEETFTCDGFRSDLCFVMARGQRVTVITHRGALGWEWIADLAVREPVLEPAQTH
jgi:hypothetical protein